MGWFFEFNLHMIINDVDQIMAIKTPNINNKTPVADLTKKIKGSTYVIFSKIYIKKASSL